MAEAETAKKERNLPAILGWGGLALFMALFAWLIISQLQSAETWGSRQQDAIALVKKFRPLGQSGETMDDLLKGYMIKAKQQDAYVGEFAWDAKQKDGSDYEVILLWKEGDRRRVAVWRVDLKDEGIRPQGDEAAGLPQRAQKGVVGR